VALSLVTVVGREKKEGMKHQSNVQESRNFSSMQMLFILPPIMWYQCFAGLGMKGITHFYQLSP